MAIFQLNKTKQAKIARRLGVTQGAISQATLNNRNIFIVEDEQGISAFELRPVFNTNPDLDKISGILLQQLEPQLPRELSRLEILQIALQAEQEKIALECKVN